MYIPDQIFHWLITLEIPCLIFNRIVLSLSRRQILQKQWKKYENFFSGILMEPLIYNRLSPQRLRLILINIPKVVWLTIRTLGNSILITHSLGLLKSTTLPGIYLEVTVPMPFTKWRAKAENGIMMDPLLKVSSVLALTRRTMSLKVILLVHLKLLFQEGILILLQVSLIQISSLPKQKQSLILRVSYPASKYWIQVHSITPRPRYCWMGIILLTHSSL